MGRTCGEPNEIKKNTHPKNTAARFREQAFGPDASARFGFGANAVGKGYMASVKRLPARGRGKPPCAGADQPQAGAPGSGGEAAKKAAEKAANASGRSVKTCNL